MSSFPRTNLLDSNDTLLDANHCVDAVMFLIQGRGEAPGRDKVVLYPAMSCRFPSKLQIRRKVVLHTDAVRTKPW
ncbi:uncharacterized protein K452DRAFT_289525 [Aplosporella prunicola CBS 121167]|uniref:Uncharacterized protein n=1 Tax=Aplosporella prunicola CBS 121167 TaxID=1176127 RepID=A0A6A6BAI8_9PEZI|nr:uncharacterized protein K452DRAFT_289525 [Aplosporella prunicola CBS 121167]KAF2139521.1 hypothetical protein K452DRAFT_289525 [Aplosporella prunicola CBS 121167]